MCSRQNTRYHNMAFLKKDLSLSQVGCSALFTREETFYLSPGVSKGEHGQYWFDIRQANLDKVDVNRCFLMPRIVPDLFCHVPLDDISTFLTDRLRQYRVHSYYVWGFCLDLDGQNNSARISAISDASVYLDTPLLNKEEMVNMFK